MLVLLKVTQSGGIILKAKTFQHFLFATLGISFLVSCDRSADPDSSIPDETDGRITITTDPEKLDDRITNDDEVILIDTTGLGKRSGVSAFTLTLVAEVTPPIVAGSPLQATSVTLNGGFAYISYSQQGDPYRGAIDVIQLRAGRNATLKSSATFTDTDIHSVYFDSEFLFVAEALEDPLFYPATSFVERLKTSGGDKLTLVDKLRTPLQSFVATSVAASFPDVFVTTGNTGYLYRLDQATLTVQDSVQLDDARWVSVSGSQVVVVQGTPGRISVYNSADLSGVGTFTFDGASIAESKSTVQFIGGKALIAAGDGGVKLVNIQTGTAVGSIDRVTVTGLDSSLTVTNAAEAFGEYVFISNGEAGVYVAQASQALENSTGDTPITLTTLGKLQFNEAQSVNHVAYDGSNLIIASGLGGVKIVQVGF